MAINKLALHTSEAAAGVKRDSQYKTHGAG